MKATLALLTLLVLLFPASAVLAGDDDPQTLEEMQQELRALRGRVQELEARADDPLAGLDEEDLEAMIDQACTSNVSAPGMLDLVIGGAIRVRFEDRTNFDFNSDRGDNLEYTLLRTRLWFDLNVTENLRAFIELQDSRYFGEEHKVIADTEGVDLLAGYIDICNLFGNGTLRAGRFQMKYGDQVMISDLDWSNVGRSWDGLKLMWEEDDYFIHFFYTRIDERLLTDGQDENEDFAGLYSSYSGVENNVIDLYLLYLRNNDADEFANEDGERGHQKLWTLGARIKGNLDNFDYGAEGGYQFGTYAGDCISAWMFQVNAGYGFKEADWQPHLDLQWILASGDSDPTDGKHETWNQLYTFGHYYLGYIDAIGRQNISSPRLRVKLKPADDWLLFCDVHYFWVMTTRDDLYNAGGIGYRSRDTLAAPGKSVGWELDLHAKVNIEKHLKMWFGWSHFFTGEYLKDTGPSDDTDFFYVQMELFF